MTQKKRIKLSEVLMACRNDQLTIGNLHAFAIIHEEGEITALDLSKRIGVQGRPLENYIAKLTKNGLIKSKRVTRTSNFYIITDYGLQVAKAFQMTGGGK